MKLFLKYLCRFWNLYFGWVVQSEPIQNRFTNFEINLKGESVFFRILRCLVPAIKKSTRGHSISNQRHVRQKKVPFKNRTSQWIKFGKNLLHNPADHSCFPKAHHPYPKWKSNIPFVCFYSFVWKRSHREKPVQPLEKHPFRKINIWVQKWKFSSDTLKLWRPGKFKH